MLLVLKVLLAYTKNNQVAIVSPCSRQEESEEEKEKEVRDQRPCL